MDHISSHKLELFVLGAAEVVGEREQIERHLLECHGCRDLAGDIREFYEDLSEELENPPQVVSEATTSLLKSNQSLAGNDEYFGDPLPSLRRTGTSRFTSFIRKYPMRATVGSFGLAAALTALLLWPASKDENPMYCNFISASRMVEVLNKKYEKLWQFKTDKVKEWVNFNKLAQVVDLDGDGVNEVLTSVASRNIDSVRGRPFTIFNSKGKMIDRKDFVDTVRYKDRSYSPYFSSDGFVVLDNPALGLPEIFLIITNDGRSPAMLVRMSGKGVIIGRYWHFGHFVGIAAKDFDGDGQPELLLTGANNVADDVRGEYPVLIVLDPEKILGEGKSTSSPGFKMDYTDAELRYVGLPNTVVDSLFHVTGIAEGMEIENDTTIRVKVNSEFEGVGRLGVEYFLGNNMALITVKSNDRMDSFRKRLVDAGKLSSEINDDFIVKLKNGVRYWDGKSWNTAPVRVAKPTDIHTGVP
jgi:hypothetical protein